MWLYVRVRLDNKAVYRALPHDSSFLRLIVINQMAWNSSISWLCGSRGEIIQFIAVLPSEIPLCWPSDPIRSLFPTSILVPLCRRSSWVTLQPPYFHGILGCVSICVQVGLILSQSSPWAVSLRHPSIRPEIKSEVLLLFEECELGLKNLTK